MLEQHGGKGYVQSVGHVKWNALRAQMEDGLQSEHEAGAGCSQCEGYVAGHGGCSDPAGRADIGAAADEFIDVESGKRHYHCHVEAVGCDGCNAPVSEHQGLEDKCYRQGDYRRPGPQYYAHYGSSHGMSCAASGDGDVEHHNYKGKGSSQGQQGNLSRPQLSAQPVRRIIPYGDHYGPHGKVSVWPEVAVRNMHYLTNLEKSPLIIKGYRRHILSMKIIYFLCQ